MSEFFATTGATREAPCTMCGRPVTQRQSRGCCGTECWSSDEHAAPCGAPCMGGGIRREARERLKVEHGITTWTTGVHGWGSYEAGDEHGPGKLVGRACPNGCEVPA